MVILLLLCAGTFALLVTLGVIGFAYRGLYFAVTVAALVSGVFAVFMTSSEADIARLTDPTQRIGAVIINTYAPLLAVWLFAVAFGSALGGLAFRERRTGRTRGTSTRYPTRNEWLGLAVIVLLLILLGQVYLQFAGG